MAETWTHLLTRWIEAGLVDEDTAARIRKYELEHAGSARLQWPVRVALAFGALMLGAGVLLFVSAHWDNLSPQSRFTLVVLLVAVFHLGAAATAERSPGTAMALHAVGTVALGAGIFLAGQIFNLDEHWPGGLMLWTLGAALGWAVLREWPQLALAAVLAPAWLCAEWFVAVGERSYLGGGRLEACGCFLLALAYFTAVQTERSDRTRQVLMWLGTIALLPGALALASVSASGFIDVSSAPALPTDLRVIGWTVALGLPLALALILRRTAAWPNVLAALWVLVLLKLHPLAGTISLYAWWAIGAMAMVAWGVRDARSERINMGAAIFGATVLAFYFSEVMDQLGRSASLVGFGLLFLAGGWALERVRRQLVLRIQGGRA